MKCPLKGAKDNYFVYLGVTEYIDNPLMLKKLIVLNTVTLL